MGAESVNEQASLHIVPSCCHKELLTYFSKPCHQEQIPCGHHTQPSSSRWLVKAARMAADPGERMGALRRTLQGGDVYAEI